TCENSVALVYDLCDGNILVKFFCFFVAATSEGTRFAELWESACSGVLQPNCYSRVVDILGKKHILIFALRRILQGEELTYDYKFPFEDVKIPCTCGSRKCRKYLN
ncbi:uncharacterized protein LOC134537247, partial [Bacillus rossius redtenbacheri]|uniref:uncharacterized protein LOC134537247 n=1 Tax=Bacillus rossius redtenbacheri TaxID=93214 RepID=UPI002FDE7D86